MRIRASKHRTGGGGSGSLAAGLGTPNYTELFNYTGPTQTAFTNNWAVSTYGGLYITEDVQFTSANISFPTNATTGVPCLALKLTQTTLTNCTGAEIVSVNALNASTGLGNYGTYEWWMRQGSSATTPTGAGTAQSGGVSSIFPYNGNNATGTVDYVEIDAPEAEGQYNTKVGYALYNGNPQSPNPSPSPTGTGFTWDSTIGDDSYLAVIEPDQTFHYYGFIWTSTSITYYLDGVLQGSATSGIPQANAGGYITNIDCNHYGTNSAGFGGTWTSGTRYAYVNSIKYWA